MCVVLSLFNKNCKSKSTAFRMTDGSRSIQLFGDYKPNAYFVALSLSLSLSLWWYLISDISLLDLWRHAIRRA